MLPRIVAIIFPILAIVGVSISLLLFSLGVRLTDSAGKDIRLGLAGTALCPLACIAYP